MLRHEEQFQILKNGYRRLLHQRAAQYRRHHTLTHIFTKLTDFKNSFTDTLYDRKLAVKRSIEIAVCRYTTLWNINVGKLRPPRPVFWELGLRCWKINSPENWRSSGSNVCERTSQKYVTISDFIDFDSAINNYQAYVDYFWHETDTVSDWLNAIFVRISPGKLPTCCQLASRMKQK